MPPSPFRISTAVVLTRPAQEGVEVYLVERSPELSFFGGFWAFPGGVVEAADARGGDPDDEALRRCALRELFEETGVLADGLRARRSTSEWSALRAQLLEDAAAPGWHELVAGESELTEQLRLVCRLTTPPFAPRRYRTTFFHLALPPGEEPTILPGELVGGRFRRPRRILDSWSRGELLIVPPVLRLLEILATRDLPDFFESAWNEGQSLEAGRLTLCSIVPGLGFLALRTPTVPPATTTNCILVGHRRVHVVDPATPHEDERARLFEIVDRWKASGRSFEGILLTHHHPDHVGSVVELSRREGLSVRAHPLTLERIPAGSVAVEPLEDGDRIELGGAPDGTPDWTLTAVHTPGHDRGHLCFLDDRYRALIAGDLVSTVSTIVIDPPEGHLRSYLDSLERVRDLGIGMLLPAHGAPHPHGSDLLSMYVEHRRQREAALLRALADRPRTVPELVREVYRDEDPRVWELAERSLFAGLEKLAEDGLAYQVGDGWCRST